MAAMRSLGGRRINETTTNDLGSVPQRNHNSSRPVGRQGEGCSAWGQTKGIEREKSKNKEKGGKMTTSDNELKQLAVKMLDCFFVSQQSKEIHWANGDSLRDTEMLHVCHLIEEALTIPQRMWFMRNLIPDEALEHEGAVTNGECWYIYHRSWQQRIEALAKKKGLI